VLKSLHHRPTPANEGQNRAASAYTSNVHGQAARNTITEGNLKVISLLPLPISLPFKEMDVIFELHEKVRHGLTPCVKAIISRFYTLTMNLKFKFYYIQAERVILGLSNYMAKKTITTRHIKN
jgi:hypothetical protein